MIQTAPQLLAIVNGKQCKGLEQCFFCGGSCEKVYPASSHVRDTFAAHPTTFAGRTTKPKTDWFICDGCMIAMKSDCVLSKYEKPQRWWTFSHVISEAGDGWYTKGDLAMLAKICLSPPIPCAIALADSGKKHQLYLAPVNNGGEEISVILECEVISFRPSMLADAIDLCARVAVASGKPTLSEPSSISLGISLSRHWSDWEPILDQWTSAQGSSLIRLAAWLTPGKETLLQDTRYAADIIASPAPSIRRASLPEKACRTIIQRAADGQPSLFG
jgi:hypothetical protein